MAREYFCAFHSMRGAMRKLSDAEVGRLFRGLLYYSETGEQPTNLQGREELLFDVFSQQIDREQERYEATCTRNKANRNSSPVVTSRDKRSPVVTTRPQEKEKEEDKDKEKHKDTISAEASTAPAFRLPLIDGTAHGVTEEEAGHLQELFPAVDVPQELRKMIAWLEANPRNRKTASGVNRFITAWLSRAQDRAPVQKPAPQKPVYGGNDDYGGDL